MTRTNDFNSEKIRFSDFYRSVRFNHLHKEKFHFIWIFAMQTTKKSYVFLCCCVTWQLISHKLQLHYNFSVVMEHPNSFLRINKNIPMEYYIILFISICAALVIILEIIDIFQLYSITKHPRTKWHIKRNVPLRIFYKIVNITYMYVELVSFRVNSIEAEIWLSCF